MVSWAAPCPYASHAPTPDTTNATGTSMAATSSTPRQGTVMLAMLTMLAPANSTPTTAPTTHTIVLMITVRYMYEPPLRGGTQRVPGLPIPSARNRHFSLYSNPIG